MSYQGPNQARFNKPFSQDPQITIEGRFKRGEKADTITFHYRMNEIYELVCIVTVPPEGDERAPVYVKHKCHQPESPIDYRHTVERSRAPRYVPRDNNGSRERDEEYDPELPMDQGRQSA